MERALLEIDGSLGGGSVLRLGIGLAAALKRPVRIYNIRKSRPNPGLAAQHLAGLLAVAELCEAELEGAKLGSQEVLFKPGEIKKTQLRLEIETAGSVGLVLQTLQLACLGAKQPVRVKIEGGGTFGKWAPPLPYFRLVNFALLRGFGYEAEVRVEREGFYPKGGARAEAVLYPAKIAGPLELSERGRLLRVKGVSIASHYLREARVAERQAEAAKALLRGLDAPVEISTAYADTRSPGSGIVLAATFEKTVLGGDALRERGKRAEEVGQEAAQQLLEDLESGATLDRYMADQIIPFIGLFGGRFRAPRLTEHLRTNLALIERLLGKRLALADLWVSAV
ncbi:MAG: RNA 3'-terminal phosphate cyclase [Candidatus Acetothermia bacterium]|nr:RNA 3'-terminal phosphate cyclase [Candidatus Acetothermia bacterium]MDH7505432.1 RNA 3'-terminal phosphate cyclase [Candidatus Acetothermia bacterium]